MTKLFTDDDQEVVIQIPDDEPLKPFREKYKDDKGVAMALVEKDRFIKQLQTETAGLRADLSARKSVEDAVDRLLQVKPPVVPNPPVEPNPASQQNSNNTSGISLEDVEKLLSTKEQEVTARNNLQYTQSELKKAYGDDWSSIVQQKVKALGESVEFLESLAKTKPQILLKLLGDAPKPQAQTPTLFKGENTTAAVFGTGNVQQRTMSFYNALKAKDAAKYWTPAIQNQMHKDSLQLREAFFDV